MNDKATNPFGGKRRIVWFAIVLLVIAGGLNWHISSSHTPTPMYEGKPLSYWLECYETLNRTETSVQQADHAIQAIGTNAIPTLLIMLQKKDSDVDMRLRGLLSKQHFFHVHWTNEFLYHMLAVDGFEALGSAGSSAVPALTNLYQNTADSDISGACIQSLGAIGPPAKNAVSMLSASLANTNDLNRMFILTALGRIHSDALSAIPALTNCLNDPDSQVRASAVFGLTRYGTDARPAVPILTNLLRDPDQLVRLATQHALWRIDPQVFRQIDPKIADQFEADDKSAH